MWKFTALAVLAIIAAGCVDAICNRCNTNGVACLAENQFQLCFNDTPSGAIYTCPMQGDVCTQYGPICMPRAQGAVSVCQGRQNCGCDAVPDFLFTCTSRTTFTMCLNNQYTTTRGTCPENQLCDVATARAGGLPCINRCPEDIEEGSLCDFDVPQDGPAPTISPMPPTGSTPTASPPTVTPPPAVADQVCATQTVAGRYPYPNDTRCTNYVFCYWEANRLLGRDTACPVGRYFNRDIQNCQAIRPNWCLP